ncbi:MAG: M23 family metallopeptidase [Cyclobacteriaceae bacterium]|nr:M23 family metallopeptidase [Cyclobacteriaceae bacterium]
MKLSKVALLFFAIAPSAVLAQFSNPELKFPNDEKYIYPVRPGQPGSLAGTMGELRTTHFHSGIDIRTDNKIGIPVLASKSGYISRASMSASGYGNVLYISHPDGNTTLYAHLDEFKGPLANYMLKEQYRIKAGEIDLTFHENQFPVKQGEVIALSGNSGSSSGPHLHFDIRDSNNQALNPLRVADFTEVKDNLPPAAEKIALRTLDANSRVNDRFGRFEFYAQRAGSNFVLSKPIFANGVIGVEILSKDKLAANSPFYGGVNYIEMRVDGELIFSQAIEKINLLETRSIYTLMDFKTMRKSGSRFYKLYIADGNELPFYEASPGSGKIKIQKEKESKVEIKLKDSYGNSSTVSFRLQHDPLIKEVPNLEPMKKDIEYDLSENTLVISAKTCSPAEQAIIYGNGGTRTKEADYYNNLRSVYLLDLRKEIPDSVVICGKSIVPKIRATVPSAIEYKFYSNFMDIRFPSNSLYDTLYLSSDYKLKPDNTEAFTIGNTLIPINKPIHISLKPKQEYPVKNNFAVYRETGNGGYAYVGGEFINGRIQFYTREFGTFTILQDTISPTIRPVYVNNYAARFKIRDNLSGISSFSATINGEWLLMHYDSKSATIWSERLDKTQPLKGDFELVVTDIAGNKQTYKQKIP